MRQKILIVGSGAREHAIAEALARSHHKPDLICIGSTCNPGIEALSSKYVVGDISNAKQVATLAKDAAASVAIIGPEAPLAEGVADVLTMAGVAVVGPKSDLARIETSKSFTRHLLQKYSIPGNPLYRRFDTMVGVEVFLKQMPMSHVIKDDGLAAGKGVKVCGDHLLSYEASKFYCEYLVAQGRPFVIEEKLEGEEFSLMSFCDGETLRHMPAVQDHKRAYDGDRGPNTGGMGSYSDRDFKLPFLTDRDISEAHRITEKVAEALACECNEPYRGILYGGFIATKDGVRLIEYNARFGDPESLNILSLLKSDFVEICNAVGKQQLRFIDIEFERKASVCRYIVPKGYPDDARKGDVIQVPIELPPAVKVYLGAVNFRDGKLITTGARSLAFVGVADTLIEAEKICSTAVQAVDGPFFSRRDIGTNQAIERRVKHMRDLRRQ